MEINKIYNEDCFDTMKNHIDKNSIDLILTSPPYNMTKRKGGVSDTGRYDKYNDWLSEEDYLNFIINLFNLYDDVVKKNGICLFNLSYSIEKPSLPEKVVYMVEKETNWRKVDEITWKKSNGIPFPANQRRLSRICEKIYVFARKDEMNTFTCNRKVKSIGSNGQKYFDVVYNYIEAKNNDGPCRLNQATFSSELVVKLLNIYGDEGMVVYDSFMGTGTTAVGAIKYGMDYIGSEISEEQCKFAENRILKEKNNE